VLAREKGLRTAEGGIDPVRMLELLDRSLLTLCDRDDPREAWSRFVRPGEVVGLKVNTLSGRGNSTTVQLVDAVCERLQQAGIPAEDIVIWDRLNQDLERGGFRISTRGPGVRCLGNDVLGFEQELANHGAVASLLCRTLTQVCDCVINMPTLKDHNIAGVTASLKNMFGAIHNPREYHLNSGNPYVADVNMLPEVRRKMRLIICDASTVQYEGGPSYLPHRTWKYDGLIVGRDPVALDYTGLQLIEGKRAAMGLKSLPESNRPPKYLTTAADANHRLGTNDPGRIERLEI
jgi:uncharacterized protein (DUF362 family)